MRTTFLPFTAVLAILTASCGPSPATSPAPVASHADTATSLRAIPVRVNNENYRTMNVYLVRQGARWLVGQINGLSDTTISIPASLAPPDHRVQLTADAIGGGSTTTELLIVPPGQRIYWTLGADLSLSNASAD